MSNLNVVMHHSRHLLDSDGLGDGCERRRATSIRVENGETRERRLIVPQLHVLVGISKRRSKEAAVKARSDSHRISISVYI